MTILNQAKLSAYFQTFQSLYKEILKGKQYITQE